MRQWSAHIEWSNFNVSAWLAWLLSERWFPGPVGDRGSSSSYDQHHASPQHARMTPRQADALTGLSLGAVAINSPKGVSYECEIYDCWVLNRRGRLNVDLFSRRLVRQRLTSLRLKHPGGQKSGRPCSQSEWKTATVGDLNINACKALTQFLLRLPAICGVTEGFWPRATLKFYLQRNSITQYKRTLLKS